MPLIGYYLGSLFADMVTRYSHWVAFALLLAIGGNMIKESLGEEENVSNDMGFKSMLLLAIATSIDALAVHLSVQRQVLKLEVYLVINISLKQNFVEELFLFL